MRNTAHLLVWWSGYPTSHIGMWQGPQLSESLKPRSLWKTQFAQINAIAPNVQITLKCNGPCHIQSLVLNCLMDSCSFKSQWTNYSQSPKVSYWNVPRNKAQCLAVLVISMVISCMSAFPAFCLCSNADFWDLPSSCWLAVLCCLLGLKQFASHKGVILFSFCQVLL